MANLIGFDKNRGNIEFKGHSKLSINFMSDYLYVEPENEEFKLISSSFKWNYVMKKNLLFVFAEFNFLDFCLEFKSEQICKKIFDYIASGKKDDTEQTLAFSFDESFIKPILQKITDNPGLNSALIEVIGKWHQFLDGGEKEIYSNLMKEYGVYDTILGAITIPVMHRNELNFEEKKRNRSVLVQMRNRKRKFCRIKKEENFADENELQLAKKSPLIYSKMVPSNLFQLIYVLKSHQQKMLIFTSDKMDSFHIFKSVLKSDKFKCIKCEKKAFIDVNENGEICVRMESGEHSCKPSKKFSQNFTDIKIIRKPAYELFDNCPGKVKKWLVVFDSDNQSLCYEYSWVDTHSKFLCRGCLNKNIAFSNASKANIRNEGTEKEYIECYIEHQCEQRKYSPEKFQPIYDYVLKPNFEIQQFNRNEKEHRKCIIFDPSDRTKCYYYYYVFSIKKFVCYGCIREHKKFVTATLNQNSENEEYIILSNVKHVCEMRNYISIEKNILHQTHDFEIAGEMKIFLFEENDRERGYLFSKKTNSYSCAGCISRRGSKKDDQIVSVVVGKLLKNEETGKYSFEMEPNQIHCCEPRPYQPEKYKDIPKTFNFFYYRLQDRFKILKLAIQSPENNQLCYTFVYAKLNNYFICIECNRMKKTCSIKPQKDAKGKEYFNLDLKKHICKPVKVSTISKSDILEESGITFKSKRKRMLKFDESKIIESSIFELLPNKAGIPERKLITFCSNDKTLYFEYFFDVAKQIFCCSKCMIKKTYVTAKLHKNEGNDREESFIVMGKNDHVCEPIKFLSIPKSDILKESGIKFKSNLRGLSKYDENKIVKSPNFELRPNKTGDPCKKLIVLHPNDKTLCFEFYLCSRKQSYICNKCKLMKIHVTATLHKDDGNGEEYFIVMGNKEHICEPRHYQRF